MIAWHSNIENAWKKYDLFLICFWFNTLITYSIQIHLHDNLHRIYTHHMDNFHNPAVLNQVHSDNTKAHLKRGLHLFPLTMEMNSPRHFPLIKVYSPWPNSPSFALSRPVYCPSAKSNFIHSMLILRHNWYEGNVLLCG